MTSPARQGVATPDDRAEHDGHQEDGDVTADRAGRRRGSASGATGQRLPASSSALRRERRVSQPRHAARRHCHTPVVGELEAATHARRVRQKRYSPRPDRSWIRRTCAARSTASCSANVCPAGRGDQALISRPRRAGAGQHGRREVADGVASGRLARPRWRARSAGPPAPDAPAGHAQLERACVTDQLDEPFGAAEIGTSPSVTSAIANLASSARPGSRRRGRAGSRRRWRGPRTAAIEMSDGCRSQRTPPGIARSGASETPRGDGARVRDRGVEPG
jgi:hypothetical protein